MYILKTKEHLKIFKKKGYKGFYILELWSLIFQNRKRLLSGFKQILNNFSSKPKSLQPINPYNLLQFDYDTIVHKTIH